MDPICFQIGSFEIRWYGVLAALGFLVATYLVNLNRRYARMNSDQATSLVFFAVIAGIVGARIFFVVLNFEQYRQQLWKIVRIDEGGLVFYGGFFLALMTVILYCRWHKISMVATMDVLAPALAAGHAFGRIGCFLNGCCFGKPTDSFLGCVYPVGSAPFLRYGALALHPVQLYEVAANVLLFILLFYLVRRARTGIAMSTYIIAYGSLRFVDEFFRGDHPARELMFGVLTPAQVIGLLLVPLGILLLIFFLKHDQKITETQD